MQVDKDLARRRFSRAARSYNMWSQPQERMADGLMAMLGGMPAPASILELGCGTGLLTERLELAYPKARIVAVDIAPEMIDECVRKRNGTNRAQFVIADAENVSFDEQFDLVAGSSCFQWFVDLDGALERFSRLVTPFGFLAFSAPTNGTLRELCASYNAAAPGKDPGHRLPEMAAYLSSVAGARFAIQMAKEETHTYDCDTPEDVLRHLRGIGATRAMKDAGPGLNRSELQRMLKHYRRHFSNRDCVTCTYKSLYVLARR